MTEIKGTEADWGETGLSSQKQKRQIQREQQLCTNSERRAIVVTVPECE